MKVHLPRWVVAASVAAGLMSSVGCYPYADYYRAAGPIGSVGYQGDSKGEFVPAGPALRQPPRYVGVDPGLVVAGVAAAGILGYAIGNHHGYHHGYDGPAYGYYGPRYCGPRGYY